MENNKNRWFYGFQENLLEEIEKDYKKNKNNYYRCLIRIPDDLLKPFSEIEGFDNFNCNEYGYKVAKKNNDGSRNKVKDYDFDIIEYDNSKAREMVINHSVLVIKKDQEAKVEISKKITDTFKHCDIKNKGNSLTIQLAEYKEKRGVFKQLENSNIKYPICILSYKRANKYGFSHLTLSKNCINHYLFIEPEQEEEYRKWYNPKYCELIVADENLSKRNMGSTSMRNYILKWARSKNYSRTWMLDDNIKDYRRYWQGVKNEINGNEIFASIERYVDRYNNVGAASHNFAPFICENDDRPCIVKNGKCYSSMLLPTKKGIKFRYKHQEDNLISMEFIEKGFTNLCFNHILYNKDTSGTNKGGNREAIYNCKNKKSDGDGYKERYEYFEAILKVLYFEKKITLKEGRTLEDLMSRSTTMKSKEYHAKVDYKALLKNEINDIVKKDNYNEIVKEQEKNKISFEFVEN